MATTAYGSTYVSGTDLVANYPAASLLVAQGIDAAGYYIGRGINAQVASYTAVLTDAGKTVTMTAAGANTVTIPANASVAFVVGSRINILNLGAGACTPTAGAGVTISGTITALATNSSAAVIKTATNTWSYVPFGSGGAATLTSGDVTSTTGSPTITTSGIYTIYKFTGSGTIVLGKAGLCDLLSIGQGAGGGGNGGAGGGAGALLYIVGNTYLPSGTNTVTVGAGGSGFGATGGFNGGASLIAQYVSPGGGAGAGGSSGHGQNGASGGGAAGVSQNAPLNVVGLGISTLGFDGGLSVQSGVFPSGGGGGSSAVGAAGVSSTAGAGGAGTSNSITGSAVTYAGGGGGTCYSGGTAGAGGTGGGGAGSTSGVGANGSANLGGGGGGGYGPGNYSGGNGGSGVVIVRVVT